MRQWSKAVVKVDVRLEYEAGVFADEKVFEALIRLHGEANRASHSPGESLFVKKAATELLLVSANGRAVKEMTVRVEAFPIGENIRLKHVCRFESTSRDSWVGSDRISDLIPALDTYDPIVGRLEILSIVNDWVLQTSVGVRTLNGVIHWV